jgi:hypothetical protein
MGSYLWFCMNIWGNTRYKNSFSGILILKILPIGLAKTEFGDFFIIGNIPLYGFRNFWTAINNERKSIKISWVLSFVLIPFAILAGALFVHLSLD